MRITTPHHEDTTTLEQREHIRKMRLFSLVILCTIVLSVPEWVEYSLPINIATIINAVYAALLTLEVWLNRQGKLYLATSLYLIGLIGATGWGLAATPLTNIQILYWVWFPLALPSAIAGLFLPFWTPPLFALFESLAIFLIYQQHPQFTQTTPSAFFVYMNILLFSIALVGTLYAFSTQRAVVQADHAAHVEAMTQQENTRLVNLASTDFLTGLSNRRIFNEHLQMMLNEHPHLPLSVIMADVDHFKHINDTYGHRAGDQVLKWIAETLQSGVRTNHREVHQDSPPFIPDMVARYGGEEFIVLLPNTTSRQAQIVAERIRAEIAATTCAITSDESEECQQQLFVTLSFGVACYPQDVLTSANLVSSADTALYTAKHNGRNRVCLANTAKAA